MSKEHLVKGQSQIGSAEALSSAFLLVLLFLSAVKFLFWRQDLTMEPMLAVKS